MGDAMNIWEQTAESVRDNMESEAVWRANSAMSCEKNKVVGYKTDHGFLNCRNVRRGGSFVSVWTLAGAKISRDRAAALIAQRMESRLK